MSSAPLDGRRNRLAWRLANLALRIGTREYRERLEGITRRGLGAATRDEAAELRAAIKEYVEAIDAYYGGGQIGSAAAWGHLMDKRDALRRLADGESEK